MALKDYDTQDLIDELARRGSASEERSLYESGWVTWNLWTIQEDDDNEIWTAMPWCRYVTKWEKR